MREKRPNNGSYTNSFGQMATEYFILFGFLLVIVGIFFGYSMTYINDTINEYKIRNSLNKIVSIAENVASNGYGSQAIVYVDMPKDVMLFETKNNYIIVKLKYGDSYNDYIEYASVKFRNLQLTPKEGKNRIKVFADENDIVLSWVSD
ncbi:MAG: hypothetical protein N3D73_02205 [Candidatus Diapherotrites archaeon]|nr:hypothetical protein [Candidatus Diapherotrites archaeon]